MASTSLPDRFKLDTVFDGDTVVHKPRNVSDSEPSELEMIWHRDGKLGAGAYGVVWRERGEGSATGKLRAVKVISKQQINLWEVEALIELRGYPDLFVIFYGWFDDSNSIFIAMEYIAHGDLSDYIKEHGGTTKAHSEVGGITSQILSGLVVLHGKNICHRDLKPQNILIASPSPLSVKITDFGISKREIGTLLKTACGTAFYQAPEQLGILPKRFQRKSSYTNAIDIWSLGIVVHEILTASLPFLDTYQDSDPMTSLDTTASSAMDIELLFNYCHGFEKFPAETLESNGVSAGLIELVKSMLVANPNKRVSAKDALESPSLNGIVSGPLEAITDLCNMSSSIPETVALNSLPEEMILSPSPENVSSTPAEIGLYISPGTLGLHVLYPAQGFTAEAEIDIIAIHGLGGDSYSTWTDPSSGKLWLRDFLPTYLDDNASDHVIPVRVLTFGYDATLFIQEGSAGRGWHTVAEDFLNKIMDEQGSRMIQRPIIFICHCIGGLILKAALNYSHARRASYERILDRTKAIVFMGTPHMGSDFSQWQKLLTGIPELSLMPGLFTSSPALEQLTTYFSDRAANLFLTSFFEQEGLDGITIVSEMSARMNIPHERVIGLRANHRTMCRFASSDSLVMQTVMRQIMAVAESVLYGPSEARIV